MSEENKTDVNNEAEVVESEQEEIKKDDKKIKNLISAIILLVGLFAGSLFVDFSQLIKGGGISQKVLNDKDVFQLDGKTWVAYTDPMIELSVINDDECEECNVDELMLSLRKIMPTILTNKIDYNSPEGEKMIEEMGITTLPALVFSKEVEDSDIFDQVQAAFLEKNDKYILDLNQVGIPVGKYLVTPDADNAAIKYGSDEAKVRLVEFSDFQCPYCQMFQKTVDEVVKEYGDKVQFVFKNLPLDSIHPRSKAAAMAAECANEQGKWLEYADKLFTNQKVWGAEEDNKTFISYASQLKLDVAQFTQCLNDEKYKDNIEKDLAEADKIGISGTPAIFVNGKSKSGAIQASELKAMIDAELGDEAPKTTDESATDDSTEKVNVEVPAE